MSADKAKYAEIINYHDMLYFFIFLKLRYLFMASCYSYFGVFAATFLSYYL